MQVLRNFSIVRKLDGHTWPPGFEQAVADKNATPRGRMHNGPMWMVQVCGCGMWECVGVGVGVSVGVGVGVSVAVAVAVGVGVGVSVDVLDLNHCSR